MNEVSRQEAHGKFFSFSLYFKYLHKKFFAMSKNNIFPCDLSTFRTHQTQPSTAVFSLFLFWFLAPHRALKNPPEN
jgi:hypothetical protein